MTEIFVSDLKEFPSSVSFTEEGFMTATANIARVGIQDYAGFELGKNDSKTYRVLRDEQTVKDSVPTFFDKPITIGHQGLLTVKNAHKHRRGHVTNAYYDGQTGWIKADEIIDHPEGIAAFSDGYRWHSCGYKAVIDWTGGEWTDELGVMGEPGKSYAYDAKFTSIKGNHNALVKNPRAGENATFDEININQCPSGVSMEKYEIKLEDNRVLVLDGDNAKTINDAIVSLQAKIIGLEKVVTDSKATIEGLQSQNTTLVSERDSIAGELAGLKAIADSTPVKESIESRKEYLKVYDSVRHLEIENALDFDTVDGLKKAAVQKVNPDLIGDSATPEFINGVFVAIQDKLAPQAKPEGIKQQAVIKDAVATDPQSLKAQAMANYCKQIEDAWKVNHAAN